MKNLGIFLDFSVLKKKKEEGAEVHKELKREKKNPNSHSFSLDKNGKVARATKRDIMISCSRGIKKQIEKKVLISL